MSGILTELGVSSPEQAYSNFWKAHGFPEINRASGAIKTTPSVQSVFADQKNRQAASGFWKKQQLGLDPENYEKAQKGELKESDLENQEKTVDATVAETPTPLVFDPEILAILKDEAPFVARLPSEGQQGFQAVYNRIDTRDAPIGFVSETASLDVTGQSKDFSLTRETTDMEIYVDEVEVSEFSERASAHYMNLRDTALGARTAEHAQQKEQTILYGDNSQAVDNGSPGDPNAYDGLSVLYPTVDKSSTSVSGTKGLLKDVKSEIKSLLQGPYAVSKSDLEIWTSHTVHDHLENEADVGAKIDGNGDAVDFGFGNVRVSGVPVVPSHNVDSHSYSDGTDTYAPGSEGDVFLVNTRSTRFRSLMPLSTVPLERTGFGSKVALGEFGALIDRSGGNFGKYLSGYQV